MLLDPDIRMLGKYSDGSHCRKEDFVSINLYLVHQQDIRTGDLLSWSSNSVLGWLIKKFTKSDINHSGMAIRFSDYEDDDVSGRRFTLEALAHGIDLHLISRRLETHKGKVYWHPLKSMYDDKRSLLGAVSLQYVGVAYDYNSLFKNILGRVSAEASKLFCSEYVYTTFSQCKFIPDSKDDKLLLSLAEGKTPTPSDMSKLGWWEERIRIF